jgi:homocysteine S-methyltransferase
VSAVDLSASPGPAGAANPIARWLAERPQLVLDGALATELERRGADLNDALWSARLLLEQPELIRQVHLDYFRAGADVATTASYQATFEGFARRGLDADAAAQLMRRSVHLALEARKQFLCERLTRAAESGEPARRLPLVAASVGPYGAMRADGSEYRGHYGLGDDAETETALMAFHRPRLQVLAEAGADLLACETVPCIAEARALARLMSERPGTYGWISYSCRDAGHNSQGEAWADCVRALNGFESVAAIGINCTAPQHIEALVATARAHTTKPIVVYPNAGEVYDPVLKRWHSAHAPGHAAHDIAPDAGHASAADAFAAQAQRWAAAGARLIGGCCRTGPAEIAALRRSGG